MKRFKNNIPPPIISINSVPAMLKNGTLASAATALAKRVFPHPGGPSKRAPLGTFAPGKIYKN